MRRFTHLLVCLTLVFLALPGEARERRGDAMAAAEAAKESFANHNTPGETDVGPTGPQVTTRKLHARVVESGREDGSVAVEGERWIDGSDKPWNARLDLSASEIVAKHRAAFDGRKELGPTDLVPGHELVLVVEIPSMAIRKVKVVGSGST